MALPLMSAGSDSFLSYLMSSLSRDSREYVKSNVNNHSYLVNTTDSNPKAAANTLATVGVHLDKFIDKLVVKYVNHKSNPKYKGVKRLRRRFDPLRMVETTSKSKSTAFTINKGQKLSVCLRPKKSTESSIYDMNTLLYVSIHELAHIMSVTIGHNAEFYQNFRFLLQEAVQEGLYQPVDYMANPVNYCGIIIQEKIL